MCTKTQFFVITKKKKVQKNYKEKIANFISLTVTLPINMRGICQKTLRASPDHMSLHVLKPETYIANKTHSQISIIHENTAALNIKKW